MYDAALKLVQEKGLAGITMQEIARKAGIATGTLYIYFKNKEELINKLFAVCRKASIECYFEGYDTQQPFEQGFRKVWMNMLHFRRKHFEEVVFMDQCYHSPYLNDCTIELTRQMTQPLLKLIDRGKKEKIFKQEDSFALLIFMIGSLQEGVKHAHYSGRQLTNRSIEAMYRMCWDGMTDS